MIILIKTNNSNNKEKNNIWFFRKKHYLLWPKNVAYTLNRFNHKGWDLIDDCKKCIYTIFLYIHVSLQLLTKPLRSHWLNSILESSYSRSFRSVLQCHRLWVTLYHVANIQSRPLLLQFFYGTIIVRINTCWRFTFDNIDIYTLSGQIKLY